MAADAIAIVTGADGHEITTLESGVRVVTEAVPSVRSVALGFWMRAGSRNETPEQAGISHFLEHLLFKGTERFGSTEIDEIFDGMGAEINAGTGKETTSVYSRFLDRHLERAFDVMGEMVLRPTYPEIDSERQVVIEEIAMYDDEPSDKIHDVFAEALYGDHPLGRRVIGTADVVGSVPVPTISAYHDSAYVPENLVVAAAGSITHDEVVELARRAGEPPAGKAPLIVAAPEPEARRCFLTKETEQYYLCVGAPGISRGDERRFALRVLDAVLGGTTSSRLWQEVREKRGLAYSVTSFTSAFADTGSVGVYLGTRPDNVPEAMDVIGAELARIRDERITDEELERAKENLKGRTVLAMESTMARMNRLGSSILMDVPLLTIDEILARLDAVTADEVAELAVGLYAPERLCAAGVGGDEEIFSRALESVSSELATAA